MAEPGSMEHTLRVLANKKVVDAVLDGADIYPFPLPSGRWAFVVAEGPITTEMAERASKVIMAFVQEDAGAAELGGD